MSDTIKIRDLVEKSDAVVGQVDQSVRRICSNCSEWEERSNDHNDGECLKHDEFYGAEHSCDKYSPDPSRFCTICNSKAIEDEEYNVLRCASNEFHFASEWDYEWIDFSD